MNTTFNFEVKQRVDYTIIAAGYSESHIFLFIHKLRFNIVSYKTDRQEFVIKYA